MSKGDTLAARLRMKNKDQVEGMKEPGIYDESICCSTG